MGRSGVVCLSFGGEGIRAAGFWAGAAWAGRLEIACGAGVVGVWWCVGAGCDAMGRWVCLCLMGVVLGWCLAAAAAAGLGVVRQMPASTRSLLLLVLCLLCCGWGNHCFANSRCWPLSFLLKPPEPKISV